MISPLRQRHRRMIIALGIFLPVAFVAGIAARKPEVTVDPLPAAWLAAPQTFDTTVWERAGCFAKTPVQIQLLREQKKTGRFAIGLQADKNFIKPDLIVYWVQGHPAITDALPGDAVLLGAFSATALPLPDEVAKADGALILYSLADNEIVDVSKVISFQNKPHE